MKFNFLISKKSHFLWDFFLFNKIPAYYNELENNVNKSIEIIPIYNSENTLHSGIHEIRFIPFYFDLKLRHFNPNYTQKKYYRVDNFLVNLEGYANAEEYMKDRLGQKSRSQWRRRVHRLETCFNIEYKFYYGDISKQKYDQLYFSFEYFIKKRFKQRGDSFSFKDKWDVIKKNSYQMILEKKASFFVIYANDKPIDICLSYHFQNIMLHLIRSYDIEYSKFWLGQIDMYKQIEWCFFNNFKIFDLMWGELDYKIRWCNKVIQYEHHFLYDKKRFLNKYIVIALIKLYKIKDFLLKKKVYIFLDHIKNFVNKNSQSENIQFKKEVLIKIPLKDNLTELDINLKEYAFLRKPTFDFQYLNFEYTDNIRLFKINNEKNSYIIQGKSSIEKIIF